MKIVRSMLLPSALLLLAVAAGTSADAQALSFSSNSLNFSPTVVNANAQAQFVTITNNGAAAVNVVNYGFGGTTPNDFPIADRCSFPLAAHASCSEQVGFLPTAVGARAATFSFTTNEAGSPSYQFTFSGTATPATAQPVTLSTTALSFPETTVGSTSASQNVSVTNPNAFAVNVLDLAINGPNQADYTSNAGSCSYTLAANSTCTFSLAFTPPAVGSLPASLVFRTSGSAPFNTISLNGTGASAAAPTFSPAASSYTTRQSVTISSATSGATIYYTTDGTAPTTSSLVYTGPITVYTTETVQAIAFAGVTSPATQAAYVINLSAGIINTVAGNGGYGYTRDGNPANASEINEPLGVAVDTLGNFYIADNANSRVRKVDTNGVITTIAGNGVRGYSGDGGLAVNAQLSLPSAVAVDTAGNIYIADLNETIRFINASSGIITTIAGTGTAGFTGDGGAATKATMSGPTGIALLHPAAATMPGVVSAFYFTDVNNIRVRKVDANGIITTVAGSGASPSMNRQGDGGLAVYASFSQPTGLAIDAEGNLYICDSGFERVRRVDAVTKIITTVAGNGSYGFYGDGGQAAFAELWYPNAVALDAAGNLYISDQANERVRRVSAVSGIITTIAGRTSSSPVGDGNTPTNASLSGPTGLAIDNQGNLYISGVDSRIRKITY